MKKILLVLLSAVGTFGLNAQTSDREWETIVNLINNHNKDAMVNLVSVTYKDSVVFWDLFDEYLEKSEEVEKARIQLYEKTALSYDKMNSHTADSLAHKYFDNRMAQEKILEKYYEKIKSATNAVTAFEFYQAEVFILAGGSINMREVTAMYAGFKTPAPVSVSALSSERFYKSAYDPIFIKR